MLSHFTTRADGATACMFDLNAALNLGENKPLLMVGWDKPTASSELLRNQCAGIDLRPMREAIRMVAMAMYLGQPICLVGPQGCGKSSLLKALLGLTNWDVVITQASPSAEFLDLMGVRMPDGSWVENGPLDAYRNGKVWMLEERTCFSPGTTTDLNSYFDRAPLRVPFLGEDAIAHPNHRVVSTANDVGNGEGLETFVSSQIQTPAANRRWLFVTMDYMARDDEKALLLSACPNLQNAPAIADALLDFAVSTRSQNAFPAFSTAELTMCGKLLQISDPTKRMGQILDATYFNKLTSTQRAAAMELWQTAGGAAMAAFAAP